MAMLAQAAFAYYLSMEASLHALFAHLVDSSENTFSQHTLYVVATPIGNVADLTARAIAALNKADIVCAEDTRITRRLLLSCGLQVKRLISLREHNEQAMAERVIEWLRAGSMIVQVSDAGTPAVSDPGARLAKAVLAAGLRVSPIPGACAAIAALCASGLAIDNGFIFHGFLPSRATERQKQLNLWRNSRQTIICYEAPHRIVATLHDIVKELGSERLIAMARELTKTFEIISVLPADEMLHWVSSDTNQQRGEIVLIIDTPTQTQDTSELTPEAIGILETLAEELPPKQAARLAAKLTQASKDKLYNYLLAQKINIAQ